MWILYTYIYIYIYIRKLIWFIIFSQYVVLKINYYFILCNMVKYEWSRTIFLLHFFLPHFFQRHCLQIKIHFSRLPPVWQTPFLSIGQLTSRDNILIFHYSLSFFWCIVKVNLVNRSHAFAGNEKLF